MMCGGHTDVSVSRPNAATELSPFSQAGWVWQLAEFDRREKRRAYLAAYLHREREVQKILAASHINDDATGE